MPYYNTIEEDLTRAKEILERGKAESDVRLDEIFPQEDVRERVKALGGTIYGADIYAAYKLLESFVEIIEAMDPKVIKTVMLAQRLTRDRMGGWPIVAECVCRTRSCGHPASQHHNGVCEVCNAGLCWC